MVRVSERTWQLPSEGYDPSPRRRRWAAIDDERLSVLELGIYLLISEQFADVFTASNLAGRGGGFVSVHDIEQALLSLTNLGYLESYK